MGDHTYVYVIHIATTPEKLWQALTQSELWERYWGEWTIESDWAVGSGVKFFQKDGTLYSQGEVLAADPPKSLSYTWPEEGETTQAVPERLTWEIAPSGPGTVKLTLTHEHLTDAWYKGVSQGWPSILSSLKSLLERGEPLAFDPR